MKIAKLADMSDDELRREESSLQEQIFRLRFRLGTGNVENPSKLRHTRRDLARVKTLLRERQLELAVTHRHPGKNAPKKEEEAR